MVVAKLPQFGGEYVRAPERHQPATSLHVTANGVKVNESHSSYSEVTTPELKRVENPDPAKKQWYGMQLVNGVEHVVTAPEELTEGTYLVNVTTVATAEYVPSVLQDWGRHDFEILSLPKTAAEAVVQELRTATQVFRDQLRQDLYRLMAHCQNAFVVYVTKALRHHIMRTISRVTVWGSKENPAPKVDIPITDMAQTVTIQEINPATLALPPTARFRRRTVRRSHHWHLDPRQLHGEPRHIVFHRGHQVPRQLDIMTSWSELVQEALGPED